MNFKMVTKAAVLLMLPLALAQHDPSKCLERGKFDNDCCASELSGPASCADGYIYKKGEPCSWATHANTYTCTKPTSSTSTSGHDPSKCRENGGFDNDCCAI